MGSKPERYSSAKEFQEEFRNLRRQSADANEQFDRTPKHEVAERRPILKLMGRILGELDALTSRMLLESDDLSKSRKRQS